MKILLVQVLFIICASISFGAEINEREINSFMGDWFQAQNTGSFSKYAAMYSKNFVGIRRSGTSTLKLNHDAWLKDRKKMFKKKMIVSAGVLEIKLVGTTASVKFEQTWESETYKDKGDKLLIVVLENGKLKIVKEELLFSNVVVADNAGSKVANIIETTYSNDFSSKYTSILEKDCSQVNHRLLMDFTDAESAYKCPAIKGWQLFKVYDRDSERSWLNIANKNAVWSTAEQVQINPKYFFGYFPNIDYSPHVEWRVSKNNDPVALIFRVAVTDPNPRIIKADSWLSRLYIVSLIGNQPRFCGVATTNEEARELADKASECTELLMKEKDLK